MAISTLRTLIIIAGMTAAAYLSSVPVFRMLENRPYPLLTDLTAQESGDIRDFYWKINQIIISRVVNTDSLTLQFRHNVPNFDSYYIKVAPEAEWIKLPQDAVTLATPRDSCSIIITARNLFGAETAPFYYTVEKKDRRHVVSPSRSCISLHDLPFRFEQFTAPQMNFLRTQTLPVTATMNDEWEKFLALRSWVKHTVPFGNPRKDSNWNAVEILTAIATNPGSVFLCDEYAAVFVGACISNGLNARMIYLRNKTGKGHFAAEVWSDQQQQWIFMDPLYDFSYCEPTACYSTLDFHNLYLISQHSRDQNLPHVFPNTDYLELFHEFQIIMGNDFLTNPYNNMVEIVNGTITTLRWVDADTPRLNKWQVARDLVVSYYIPKVGRLFILATGLIACVIAVIILRRQQSDKDVILS